MLTKQDLIDMLNEMRDVPNDAHVLIDNGQYGIQPIQNVKRCVYSKSSRHGFYVEPAQMYDCETSDDAWGGYDLGIQIVLGDSI